MKKFYAAGMKVIGCLQISSTLNGSVTLDNGKAVPAVNQIEFHPPIHQDDVRDPCRQQHPSGSLVTTRVGRCAVKPNYPNDCRCPSKDGSPGHFHYVGNAGARG